MLLDNAGLDPNQLALLQQLARTAKNSPGGQNLPTQVGPPPLPAVGNGPFHPGPGPSTSNLLPTDQRVRGNGGPASTPRYEIGGGYQGGGRRYGDDHDRRDRDYGRDGGRGRRSEEHTSELQSP